MKGFMLIVLLILPVLAFARHIGKLHSHHGHHVRAQQQPSTNKEEAIWNGEMRWMHKRPADTLQIAGSTLPDCSHACGSCTPCRLVMVSFVCSSLEEAETCPMAYKCMCHNKSYPIP